MPRISEAIAAIDRPTRKRSTAFEYMWENRVALARKIEQTRREGKQVSWVGLALWLSEQGCRTADDRELTGKHVGHYWERIEIKMASQRMRRAVEPVERRRDVTLEDVSESVGKLVLPVGKLK